MFESAIDEASSRGVYMEAEFWHNKWRKMEIGFHQLEVNSLLKNYFDELGLIAGSTILVPLCGKSHDLHWLAAQGMKVIGIELSELAVRQFFTEAGVEPAVEQCGLTTAFSSGDITIIQGDIFDLSKDQLSAVQAIYDRAALIALPDHMRQPYAHLLTQLAVPQLLITVDYDQSLVNGPPFSVDEHMVDQLYADTMQMSVLARQSLADGLKGRYPADQLALLLRPIQLD